MNNKVFKIVLSLSFAFIIFFLLVWGHVKYINSVDYKLSKLQIKNCKEIIVEEYDDHGGFHNDGLLLYKITFEEPEKVEKLLEESTSDESGWYKFPMEENLQQYIQGFELKKEIQPVIDEIGEISNGYWYFVEQNHQLDSYIEYLRNGFDKDFSHNFTVAIYDADENVLYYMEYDS